MVLINLAFTSYIALKKQPDPSTANAAVDDTVVSEAKAASLAKQLITLFNASDVPGVYAMFDDLAKAQISQDQLNEQVAKLHSVLGSIGTFAFDRAELAGTDAGRTFYNINYKVALNGGPFPHGTLKITVVRRGEELRLVGFFLNGTDSSLNR